MRLILTPLLILAGVLFSCAAALGQRKFAVSVNAAPYFGQSKTTTTIVLPDEDGNGTFTSQEWKAKANPKGYSVGLNGRYSFSQKWSAATGFWFTQSRIKSAGSSSRSRNFSIPVLVNLQTRDKPLSPYFSAGALYNFGTTSRMHIPDFGTVIFKSTKHTSKIAPMVGAGIIYHFAEHLSLIAQPTFSYAIPPSDIKSRAYQFSMNVQLMIRL
jgi:opacity protein-like surface antigen